ncbi:S-methyl-5-thioribose-1-phosphate isomerase [Metallumcola ferriviriculae]|uniref:Methylthioribose-1-phosphate isomerase n=1 Tax=Metallumcola ferriviriculae TaxID=3039180 RepID=A0AAU0UMQ7_9FIRM|nr:S-methyl-5-thioribose-1-phosphate isomerase [Desulfitibacteraceae bacterium MK1]
METMSWQGDRLLLLDQQKLPSEIKQINCFDYLAVADAIRTMKVRGAPAIGAAAAFGMVLGAMEFSGGNVSALKKHLEKVAEVLLNTRPTAVNLFWAVKRMQQSMSVHLDETPAAVIKVLEKEAEEIFREDVELNKKIGYFGSKLIPQNAAILTHCNAGSLATAGYGTAIGVIRTAHSDGKQVTVFADETRPLLQGARLTAWELQEDRIPVTLITDSMAGYLMQLGKIDLVIVGADRIAANGDVANKIGTYSLAVLAKAHAIPFYVAAPYSTIDMALTDGSQIVIEERDHEEVRRIGGIMTAPVGIPVFNPAFDVTTARLISAIITDKGVVSAPYQEELKKITGGGSQ